MSAVSETGRVNGEEYKSSSQLSNGYSYFQKNDVLVAKITPCYENNKIAVAEIDREHGFGSTEFHVIRPKNSVLDPRYLAYFLRQDAVRERGRKRMTGSAGQRRVPRQFLEQLEIPLPPLAEQRRIAAILDQADALRRKRREAIDLLDQQVVSSFVEIFGSQEVGSTTWPLVPLGNLVVDTAIGLVRSAAEFGPHLPIPYIRMNAITRKGKLDLSEVDRTNASPSEIERYKLRKGDFLFNTRNSRELVGKTAVFDSDGLYI